MASSPLQPTATSKLTSKTTSMASCETRRRRIRMHTAAAQHFGLDFDLDLDLDLTCRLTLKPWLWREASLCASEWLITIQLPRDGNASRGLAAEGRHAAAEERGRRWQ